MMPTVTSRGRTGSKPSARPCANGSRRPVPSRRAPRGGRRWNPSVLDVRPAGPPRRSAWDGLRPVGRNVGTSAVRVRHAAPALSELADRRRARPPRTRWEVSVEDTTVESGRPAGRTTCRSVDAVPPAFDDFGATSALAVCDASTGQEPAISDALAVVAPRPFRQRDRDVLRPPAPGIVVCVTPARLATSNAGRSSAVAWPW